MLGAVIMVSDIMINGCAFAAGAAMQRAIEGQRVVIPVDTPPASPGGVAPVNPKVWDWRERLDLTFEGKPMPFEGGPDDIVLLPSAFQEVSRDCEAGLILLTYTPTAARMGVLKTTFNWNGATKTGVVEVDTTCRGLWYTAYVSKTLYGPWLKTADGRQALTDGQSFTWEVHFPDDWTQGFLKIYCSSDPFHADALPEGLTVTLG